MAIDPEDVRKHFASLNDDALLLVEREDLTSTAQKIFDAEVQHRQLDANNSGEIDGGNETESDGPFGPVIRTIADAGPMRNTFPITTYNGATSSGTSDATDALSALHSAGIPCEIIETKIDPADKPVGSPYMEYQVMVPDAFVLQASAVLDIVLHNVQCEEDWRASFSGLSDEELKRLDIDALCTPILDRAARLRKVFKEEIARRSRVIPAS